MPKNAVTQGQSRTICTPKNELPFLFVLHTCWKHRSPVSSRCSTNTHVAEHNLYVMQFRNCRNSHFDRINLEGYVWIPVVVVSWRFGQSLGSWRHFGGNDHSVETCAETKLERDTILSYVLAANCRRPSHLRSIHGVCALHSMQIFVTVGALPVISL